MCQGLRLACASWVLLAKPWTVNRVGALLCCDRGLGLQANHAAQQNLIISQATHMPVQVYGIIGIFGAARYGLATAGNILVNTWLGFSPVAEGALDLAVGAYLSISIPPILARPGPCSARRALPSP